jgi:Cu2+-exporting ATPase
LFQYNNRFKITLDSFVVTDGIVISGESEVDESMITGEAALVAKKPGSSVVVRLGTLCHHSSGILPARIRGSLAGLVLHLISYGD